MLKDSQDLVEVLKTYSVDELVELMGISKRIAELNLRPIRKMAVTI